MKIGILTYHRVINYGAFLQAYSLVKKLEHCVEKNIQVELIDYVPSEHIELYGGILKRAIQSKEWSKVEQFRQFWKAQKKLHVSKMILIGKKEFVNRAISKQHYDIIIVGSDEVWKEPESIYWLRGVECDCKMSYAASSRILESNLTKEQRENIKNSLNEFAYIGVRDLVSKREFEKIIEKEIHLNCDPTFLMDIKYDIQKFKKAFYEKYQISEKYKVVGVMLDAKDGVVRQIKRIYGKEYKIVSLYKSNREADINVIAHSPFEWVKIIMCLDGFVTSYFHGVVYALKCNTNFVAIDYLPQNTSKIYDLLCRENLLERYIEGSKFHTHNRNAVEIIERCKEQKCDYSNVRKSQRKLFTSFDKALVDYINQ